MRRNRKIKKPNSPPKLVLGHVIGLTTKNANGFDSNESSSKCVYIAGCVVVVCDVGSNGLQSSLMVTNRTPKPLTCVALSNDGRFVTAGELGDQAAVLVWDCISSVLRSELKSHQHGVECIAFSPDGNFLASIGFLNDGYICLWDLENGVLVSRLKACPSCSSVQSVCFSSDGNFIVTAGKKHMKVWKVMSSARTRAKLGVKSLSMHGKPINLGNQKESSFIAVKAPILADDNVVNFGQACETCLIYGLTDAGVLCLISGSKFRKTVDIKVNKAFALSVSNKLIACACNNGVVKLFTTESLNYSGSLRHDNGEKCKEKDDIDSYNPKLLPPLPHAIACQFSTSEKLVVVYGDNSIFIWGISDLGKATSHQVLVSHSGCILDIKSLPCETMHDPSLIYVSRGCSGGTSFATCSEDGTVRLWNLSQTVSSISDKTLVTNSNTKLTKPVKPTYTVNSEIFEPESEKVGFSIPGFRSMAISSDGKHLAGSYMNMDPTTEVVVTVGKDKRVNIFSTDTGSFIRSFKQGGDFGEAIKVIVDQSSNFLVCSYSDRSICIYDFLTGEIAAQAVGHGDVITGMTFLPDCHHIVSVSGDGCIFVWRLPTLMSTKMLQKVMKNSKSSSPSGNVQPQTKFYEDPYQLKINPEVKQTENSTPVSRRFSCQGVGLHEISVFKFSISRLPKWAQTIAINPIVDPSDKPSQQVGNSSSVDSHDCSNILTPSKHENDSGDLFPNSISRFSSDTTTSQGSRLPREGRRMSFAMDGRWLTIHTVCLDLLTSPEVSDMRLMVNAPNVPDQAQSETVKRFKQPIVASNSSCMKRRDRVILKHNLTNLSAQSKELHNFALNRSFKPQSNLADGSTMNQQKMNFKQSEEQDTIIACKEALLDMQNAVENAYHMFSKLRNVAIRGDLSEPEAGLYSHAAEILPSIAMKFHAVTKTVECSYKTCWNTEDILSFDSLLGAKSENCLQRVAAEAKNDKTLHDQDREHG